MPSQRKTPFRPRQRTEISQAFNDGVVEIYSVSDGAQVGLLPRENLTPKGKLFYQERKLGIKRHYEAAQNQIHVERVIRVPMPPMPITNQDAAITEDGRTYRIDLVQVLTDVWPRSLDLTLVAYEQQQSQRDNMEVI